MSNGTQTARPRDVFQAFLDRWITPSMLLTVIGLIIWGAQLNWNALQQAKVSSENRTHISQIQQQLNLIAVSQAETAILLRQVTEQVQRHGDKLLRHEEEAEQWKRRIMLNEERVRKP